jgi:hypothetical protein
MTKVKWPLLLATWEAGEGWRCGQCGGSMESQEAALQHCQLRTTSTSAGSADPSSRAESGASAATVSCATDAPPDLTPAKKSTAEPRRRLVRVGKMLRDRQRAIEDSQPCWELDPKAPRFCASLANGHGRCRKGTCVVLERRRSEALDELARLSKDLPLT